MGQSSSRARNSLRNLLGRKRRRETGQPVHPRPEEPVSAPAQDSPLPPQPSVPPPPTPPPPPPPEPQHPRQFPPPGTLVVVQGIVHTTDVSRSANSDPPPPSTPSSARDRLLSLLGRDSSHPDDHPTARTTPDPEQPPPQSSSTTPARGQQSYQQRGQHRQNSTPHEDRSAISSNSIDVLGTLLSVAAAATAASLLTGSSEPILSSGLAPSPPSAPTSPTAPASSINHTSPPQPPPPLLQNTPLPPLSAPDAEVERPLGDGGPSQQPQTPSPMARRNAWNQLRERLRLRARDSGNHSESSPSPASSPPPPPSPPPVPRETQPSPSPPFIPPHPTPSSSFTASQNHEQERHIPGLSSSSLLPSLSSSSPAPPTAAVPALTDTREQMLAEMARAFNLGLGLNTGASSNGSVFGGFNPHTHPRASSTSRTADADRELPPEGSFERFLVELQADLRVVLSMDSSSQSHADEERGDQGREEEVEEPLLVTTAAGRHSVQSLVSTEPADSVRSPDDPDMPALQDVTDDSSSESEAESSDDEDEFLSTTTSPPVLAPALSSSEASSNDLESSRIPRPVLEVVEDDEEERGSTPPLQENSTSSSTPTVPNEPATAAPATAGGGVTTGGGTNGFDASGRLNWWRAYRFPAVASSGAATAAPSASGGVDGVPAASRTRTGASSTTSSSTTAGSGPSSSTPSSSTSTDPAPNTENTTITSSLPPPPPPPHSTTPPNENSNAATNSNSVVPVIIVGLQSVNAPNWRPLVGMEGDDLWGHNHNQNRHNPQHPHRPSHHHSHSLSSLSSHRQDRNRRRRASGFSDYMHRRDGDEEEETFAMREEGVEGEAGDEEMVRRMMGVGDSSYTRGTREEEEEEEDDDVSSLFDSQARDRRSQRARERERRGWRSPFGGYRSGSSGSSRRGSQSEAPLPPPHQATPNVPLSPIGGAGSRTFLIYVIGGYYPPDHSIVTGGPDNLESFEALLELVEMLGNAKASTASKDDIEKSGLEVIKKAQLEVYEQEKKVASNCVERCLICLDEYEEEDEIRVMGCKHAFHRGCVDTWLETGKNNCPACRSTGVVSTTNPTTTSTTGTQTQTMNSVH